MLHWKNVSWIFLFTLSVIFLSSCEDMTEGYSDENASENDVMESDSGDFQWEVDRFADLRILRYRVPGWDKLSLQQKKYAYYLTQAGLEGRDIFYATNYRHNLEIRHALDSIYRAQHETRSGEEWDALVVYLKRVWFSSGIHHHYSHDKFKPGFSKEYLKSLLEKSDLTLSDDAMRAIFDESYDNKKVSLDPSKDLLLNSAVNFYGVNVSEEEATNFYNQFKDKSDKHPVSYGLNSQLVDVDGELKENVYKIGGLYSDAIKEIVKWLEKAIPVAENQAQADALKLLIEYYKTGSLETWDDYCVAWVEATEGDIDYINGYIEVYNDPLGYKGGYETIVEINDFEASKRMSIIAEHAQYFEDNSPIMDAHKKDKVVGVTYKVVNVVGEAGATSPSSPIGVNLPNSQWIRKEHGSKSVSLGNLIYAYNKADGPAYLKEFSFDKEEVERAIKYGTAVSKIEVAMHEVIGHASGKLEEGVPPPKVSLKNYASTLEEARADLVALYYLPDPKMVEWGLLDSPDAYKAAYDGYIRNGLMLQLRRLDLGDVIEEAHMRNRQLIAKWVFEHGKKNNVIEKVKKDGKTYFNINDYVALRDLFGQLLREIQRIKSQGDYDAAKKLVETYGVQVNQEIHKEVLDRWAEFDIPAYSGFLNPYLIPVKNDDGKITDIKIEYGDSFMDQMLLYDKKYSNIE